MPTPAGLQKASHLVLLSPSELRHLRQLIDHHGGIRTNLAPLAARLPGTSMDEIHKYFKSNEEALAASHLSMLYSTRLADTYANTASSLGLAHADNNNDLQAEAAAFGNSVGTWPAFPDTIAAMQRLSKHFSLVALSNCDHASYAATLAHALQGQVQSDAHYLAEDIGSYKPALQNFEYLVEHVREAFGVEKEQVLHVAQGLWYDHVATKPMGISSVWIDRFGDRDVHGLVEGQRVGFG